MKTQTKLSLVLGLVASVLAMWAMSAHSDEATRLAGTAPTASPSGVAAYGLNSNNMPTYAPVSFRDLQMAPSR